MARTSSFLMPLMVGPFRIRSSILSLQSCIRWVSGIPQPKGTTSTFSRVRVSYSFTVLLLSEKPSGPEPARRSIYCMTTTLPASIKSPMFFRK